MGKINVLSFAVANLIAAGEVVDRPSSVIKELLENAIDSGADRVTVEIQNGGVVFMRVSDNGCGIEKDDLSVAVRRHATSKIKDASDLDGILTLGFRGEALAAIAAVSDLRIISRVNGSENGAVIEVSGGDILGVRDQGCAVGTSVIVENLFGNVPARRKFLKRDVTETAAVHSVVEKIALSKPGIAITFIADGNIKFQTAGDGKLINTIYALYGREFAKSLLEVNYECDGISVSGFTGRSDNVRPNRNGQNFFINGRLVKSKTAMAALEQAYCSYMPPEKYPVCVLFVDVNPKNVDVNVHPSKLEVKFSNEKPVFEAVYYGIKNTLESNVTRPDISPEKISRMSYSDYNNLFSPKPAETVYNTLLENPPSHTVTSKPEKSDFNISGAKQDAPDNIDVRYSPEKVSMPEEKTQERLTADDYAALLQSEPTILPQDNYDEETIEEFEKLKRERSEVIDREADIPCPQNDTGSQQTVEDTGLCDHRIIGEVFNSYVIVERGEKILLIDKHAAHERIIFERLKKGLRDSETHSQFLMIPLEFMMTSDEVLTLEGYRDEIEKIGFQYTTQKYTVTVNAVPETIELSAVPDIFMTIADRIKNSTGNAGLTRDIIFEKALYQASCKAAVKAGREYGPEHIKWIVEQLMLIPDITFCPHGRPVALEMSKASLDKQFKRT